MPCPNCENTTELPDITISLSEICCDFCNVEVFPDTESYHKCERCDTYYLSCFYDCLECGYISPSKNISQFLNYPISDINDLKTTYLYIKNENDYINAILAIENLTILAVDTEGNGLDPYTAEMFLIQIGNQDIVYIFDFTWFDKLKKEHFWSDVSKTFILHNAKFDYKMLKHNLNICLINIFDTMLAERILTCGLYRENSLKAVAKKYLKLDLDKELRLDFIQMKKDNFHDLINDELVEYSARDVMVLPLIYEFQKIQLRNEDLDDIARLEFEAVIPISEIELAGIYVDVEKWKKIIDNNEKERDRVKAEIFKMISDKSELIATSAEDNRSNSLNLFSVNNTETNSTTSQNDVTNPLTRELNLNSTPTLKKIFLNFGITLEDTSDLTLANLKHPLADLIREYRGYEKQLSAFGQSFLNLVRKETNRVHPTFNQIGADTGRMSCNNPNMQQIPATEEYRSCFIAPPGRKIVTCDYSQQELRLLASLSGDPKFIKTYEDGVDLHSATASLMYNIPIEEVPKDKRSAAKTINFGLAYGRGAKALADFLGISKEEGEEMIKIYFSQFSYIGEWLENAAKTSQEKGYSQTLMGRKRFYKLPSKLHPEYKSEMARIGRQGKNSPIQGSGVDMVKLALIKIRKKLLEEKLDAFLINTVHDEIVIESSEKDAEKAYEVIETCMVEAGKSIVPNVPILAEAAINDFWKH